MHADASDDMSTRRAVAYSLANDITLGPMPVALAIPRASGCATESRDDHVLEAAVGRHLSLPVRHGRPIRGGALARAARPRRCSRRPSVESLSWGSLGASSRTKMLIGDVAGAERDLRDEVARLSGRGREDADARDRGRARRSRASTANRAAGTRPRSVLPRSGAKTARNGDRLVAEAMLASHYGNHEEAVILARRAVEMRQRTDALNGRAEAWLTLAEAEQGRRAHRRSRRRDRAGTVALRAEGHVVAAARTRSSALLTRA